MTYIDLINRSDNFLKQRNLDKSIILKIIYKVVPEINSLTDLTTVINNEIPKEYLEKILDFFQFYLVSRKPIYEIIKSTNFCNMNLIVNKHVLCPRPETEEWTKMLLEIIKDYGKLDILDLCCGTGAIGLAIKKTYEYNNVTLSDISKLAFDNANMNAKNLNLDVNIVLGNLFENIGNKKFDVIVFNPPYVDTSYELNNSYDSDEPYNAIYAPNRGLWFYDAILKNIKKYLKPNYLIMMEIGFNLAGNVGALITKYLGDHYDVYEDYNGIDRVIVINKLQKY